ncbi:MAG: YceD family protein [Aquificaceae bacterium]|nr:YceD family protein [Aquificaceae bacterium]MDW8423698.1 YceD family protein [Aquificaceae bacterium]
MVTLNLKEIFKTKNKFVGSYSFSPEGIKLPPDLGEIKEPIKVYVEITKEKGGYRIYMEIEGYVVLECSRCLTLYQKDVGKKESLRIEPYPTRDVLYLKPSELDVSFYEDEESFNLTDLVREQIILSLPTKPLCSPNCSAPVELFESKAITLGDLLKRDNVL